MFDLIKNNYVVLLALRSGTHTDDDDDTQGAMSPLYVRTTDGGTAAALHHDMSTSVIQVLQTCADARAHANACVRTNEQSSPAPRCAPV